MTHVNSYAETAMRKDAPLFEPVINQGLESDMIIHRKQISDAAAILAA